MLRRRYGRARAPKLPVPSPEQAATLRKLVEDPQHRLHRMSGGFWTTRATPMRVKSKPWEYDIPEWHTGTLTVRSMEKKGWLIRAHVTDKEWADDRELTDEGRAALARVP